MKHSLKTALSLTLCAALAVPLVSCSGSTASSSAAAASSAAANSTAASSAAAETTLPIVKEPITLTILAATQSTFSLSSDLPFYKELAKRTNITLDIQLLPSSDTAQKFNVIMASGNLPDLVDWTSMNDVTKYGTEGAFIPLEKYISQCPNIKKVLTDPPIENLPFQQSILGYITSSDGHIYSLPFINPSSTIGAVFAIRTDWLTKVGDTVPTTTDELEKVLLDFKNKDPNGNGQADEIPYVVDSSHWNALFPLINAFGAHMDLYLNSKTDTIQYGPMEDAYKDGLTYLNKLYSEGLIDTNYASATSATWIAQMTGSIGGMTFTWPGSGLSIANTKLQAADSGALLASMLPVKGPNGYCFKDTKTSGSLCNLRMSITKNNKYPLETMKMIDYLFSDAGYLLVNYGIEGTDYTMVNGKPVYTDSILKNADGKSAELAKVSQGYKTTILPWWDTWEPEIATFSTSAPYTVDCWKQYFSKNVIEAPMPNLSITDSDALRTLTDIGTYRDETANGMLTGKISLSTFGDYQAKLKEMGIENVLKVYNEAYKSYKENIKNLALN